MEGVVANYNALNGALTITSALFAGAGTYAEWNVSITGQRGARDPAGSVNSVNGKVGPNVLVSEFVAPTLRLGKTTAMNGAVGRVYSPATFDYTYSASSLQTGSIGQTDLSTAVHVSWIIGAPGASRDGWLTGFTLPAGCAFNAGATLQAWLVRPVGPPPANLFDPIECTPVLALGEWDLSAISPTTSSPRLVFDGLFARRKEGDLIAVRCPQGMRLAYATLTGEVNSYPNSFMARANPAAMTLDALNSATTFTNAGVYGHFLHDVRIMGGSLAAVQSASAENWTELPALSLSQSSAGVFQGETLIRTLWSEKPFNGQVTSSLWDGLDDDGNVAPSDDYTIRVLDASGVKYEWLGCVGNNGQPNGTGWQPYDSIHDMVFTNTGKMYAACGYNEALSNTFKSTAANPLVAEFVRPIPHRFAAPSTFFVATDNERAYFGAGKPYIGPTTSGLDGASFIFAVTVADDAPYVFSSGTNAVFSGGAYSAANLVLNTTGASPKNYYGNGIITGLAVQQSGNLMFASRGLLNQLHVTNKLTGASVATITSFTAPTRMCIDPISDGVWLVTKPNANWLAALYSVNPSTGAFTLVAGTEIVSADEILAICTTPDGTTVRIACGGSSQQIKSYSFGADKFGGAGAFASATGWTFTGAGLSIAGGTLNGDGTGSDVSARFSAGLTVGKAHYVEWNIVSRSAGSVNPATLNLGATNRFAPGTYREFRSAATSTLADMRTFAFNGSVDNYIIREINASVSTFGQAGGYANGPAVAVDKFGFYNTNGNTFNGFDGVSVRNGANWAYIAHQPDGKVWIGDPFNRRNMRYNVSGTVWTFDTSIEFVGSNYSQAIVHGEPTRVFSDWREYSVDYSKKQGEPGFYTLVRNYGWSIPATLDDQYTRMKQAVKLSNGRTYCLMRDYTISGLRMFEITSTGLRDTGVTSTGLTIDNLAPNGDIRRTVPVSTGAPHVFSRRPLTGFDGSHNPVYGPLETVYTSANTTADDPKDLRGQSWTPWYLTSGGVIPAYDYRKEHLGKHLALIKAATGAFLARVLPSTPSNRFRRISSAEKARMTRAKDWPTDHFDVHPGSMAGNACDVVGPHIFASYHGESWGPAQVNMTWHFHESGLLVANFGTTLEGTGRGQPWMAGNAVSRTAIQIDTNTIIVSCNDESYGSGVHIGRITGFNSIAFHQQNITWNAANYAANVNDPGNLLVSLPYNASLANGVGGWTRSPSADIVDGGGAPTSNSLYITTNERVYDTKAGMTHRPSATPRPDLHMFGASPEVRTASFTRALPTVGTVWRLGAEMYWTLGDIGTVSSPGAYTRIEAIDAGDRIIARLNVNETVGSSPGRFQVYANGTLWKAFTTRAELQNLMWEYRRMSIRSRADGQIVFNYDTLDEIVVAPLNPSATWGTPAKVRVTLYWGGPGFTGGRTINFRTLRID